MPAPTSMHRQAVRHLERTDPVMAGVIASVGRCRFAPRTDGTHFDSLVRAIIYQQLSGKAAATIHGRVVALYGTGGDGGRPPTARDRLDTADDRLRAAGLSRQKISYLRDLAARVDSGALPLDAVEMLEDDAIIDALVHVKGIGRWTAHMFLIFRLGRPNVLPELDLGIRKAIKIAYRKRKMPTPEQVRAMGRKWDPYCTVASWYLWRYLDG